MMHIACVKLFAEKLAALVKEVSGLLKADPGIEVRPPVISAEQDLTISRQRRQAEPGLGRAHDRQAELEPARTGVEIGPTGMRAFVQLPEFSIKERERERERELEAGG